MKHLEKIPESRSLIRFPDCDPFNHLNNSRYLDYFINAREDHLLQYYNFNIYQYAKEKGLSWVVALNQVAYLKPAMLMETVVIQSTLVRMGEKEVWVEMRMWNESKTTLKSLLWVKFIHYNLLTQKSEVHSKELLEIFEPIENPFKEAITFEARIEQLRGKSASEVNK